jgi:hypothetical protein
MVQTEVQVDPKARGPEGTVPVVPFNVEYYLEHVPNLPENPADVFKKPPPPSPDSNGRYYGVWRREGTFFGTGGQINIWETAGPVDSETSIAQTAVIRGDPMQAIEAGKIELDTLNGNKRPHFFTFYRTSGEATGDWVGGYNAIAQRGWIQVSHTVAPGMSLVNFASKIDGTQDALDLEVRLWNGNWWVRAAGEWAGYYPACIGGSSPPCSSGTLFSDAGIRDKADRLEWFGEVYESSAPTPTKTEMGSGKFASDGLGKAAFFRNLTFYWQPTTYGWWNSGTPTATDSGCYSVAGPFYSQTDPWHNWFFYGGSGKGAAGCH